MTLNAYGLKCCELCGAGKSMWVSKTVSPRDGTGDCYRVDHVETRKLGNGRSSSRWCSTEKYGNELTGGWVGGWAVSWLHVRTAELGYPTRDSSHARF